MEALRQIHKELDDILRHEEILWAQKSRIQWLQWRDRNSKYFHIFTLKWRNKNIIYSIKSSEGISLDREELITKEFQKYYEELFTTFVVGPSQMENLTKNVTTRLIKDQ